MVASTSKQATHETNSVSIRAESGHPASPDASPDPAQRHLMIAEAAFYIAQERGFTPSQELDDWLTAEREVEQRMADPAL